MFTRIVECQAKRGKTDVVANKVRNEVLPTLRKQPGFVDFMALRDNEDDQRVVCVSFWDSNERADAYLAEHYDIIVQVLEAELQAKPTIATLRVEVSTAHSIAAGRAAA